MSQKTKRFPRKEKSQIGIGRSMGIALFQEEKN